MGPGSEGHPDQGHAWLESGSLDRPGRVKCPQLADALTTARIMRQNIVPGQQVVGCLYASGPGDGDRGQGRCHI